MVYSGADATAEMLMDSVFAALAHPARREIVRYLATQPTAPRMNVVAADHGLSPQLLNKHTAALEKAGLASRVSRGRHSHLVLHAERLAVAEAWVQQTRRFWEQQMGSLEAYVAELNTDRTDTGPNAGEA